MIPFELPLRCLKVRLEVCPGFLSRFLPSHLSQFSSNRPVLYTSVYMFSTISLSAIVRPPSFANSCISFTCCTNSCKGRFASHGSDKFERFSTRSWYYTSPYSLNKFVIMSLTRRCANPRLRSKTPERDILLTASAISFLPAHYSLTHSLNSLTASEWSRLSFLEVKLLVPDGMTSGPGSGVMMNTVPGATIVYTVSGCSPPR